MGTIWVGIYQDQERCRDGVGPVNPVCALSGVLVPSIHLLDQWALVGVYWAGGVWGLWGMTRGGWAVLALPSLGLGRAIGLAWIAGTGLVPLSKIRQPQRSRLTRVGLLGRAELWLAGAPQGLFERLAVLLFGARILDSTSTNASGAGALGRSPASMGRTQSSRKT